MILSSSQGKELGPSIGKPCWEMIPSLSNLASRPGHREMEGSIIFRYPLVI